LQSEIQPPKRAICVYEGKYRLHVVRFIHDIRYDGITYITSEQNKTFLLKSNNRIASEELQISGKDNYFYFDEDLPDAFLIMQLTSFAIRCITGLLIFAIWLRYIPLSYI